MILNETRPGARRVDLQSDQKSRNADHCTSYKERVQAGLGLQTKDLIVLLTKQKFEPVVLSTIKKPEFTVSGNIILIDNDNIAVFEYDNIDIAKAEVASRYFCRSCWLPRGS